MTNDRVDGIYANALAAGEIGGKLLGAGGGGFMLLFVPPDQRDQVRQKFNRLIHVPFKFESQGSQVVLFEPEVDYSEDVARQGLPTETFQELCEETGCFAA